MKLITSQRYPASVGHGGCLTCTDAQANRWFQVDEYIGEPPQQFAYPEEAAAYAQAAQQQAAAAAAAQMDNQVLPEPPTLRTHALYPLCCSADEGPFFARLQFHAWKKHTLDVIVARSAEQSFNQI